MMTNGSDLCGDGINVGNSFASKYYKKYAIGDPLLSQYYMGSLVVLDDTIVTSFHSQYASTEYPVALHALKLSPGYVGEAVDHSAIAWSYFFGNPTATKTNVRFINGGT